MDNMTAERALSVLRRHNDWRRGAVDEWPDSAKEIGEAIDFACSALSAPRVPEGWKLVPVEPTREMRKAFHEANDYAENVGDVDMPDYQWRAMLDTTPITPPTPDPDELTRLRARVAELEADAERLDYLSRNNRSVHAIWAEAYAGRQVIRWSAASDRGDHTQWKKTIRQAVDAALAAAPPIANARLREGGE